MRYHALGSTLDGRLLHVTFTRRQGMTRIRIIPVWLEEELSALNVSGNRSAPTVGPDATTGGDPALRHRLL